METLMHSGPRQGEWTGVADSPITGPRDAIIQVDAVTTGRASLYILNGDEPAATCGRTPGHEAADTVLEVDAARGDCDATSLERDRSLVLRSAVPMGGAAPLYDFTQLFALRDEPRDELRRATRRPVRERGGCTRPAARLLVEPVEAISFPTGREMPHGLKRRAQLTAIPPGDSSLTAGGE